MNCNICDSEIEQDNGDIVGFFGICPVAFCVWCLSSMTDMVVQLQGFDEYKIFRCAKLGRFTSVYKHQGRHL